MTDNLSGETRSKVMASIRSKDTSPELLLWKYLDHRAFRRYPRVIGRPDFGNVSKRIAVFVDGCFWHGCPNCYKAPTTRKEYWENKLQRNRDNDKKVNYLLNGLGFKVLRFWEHEIRLDPEGTAMKARNSWSAQKT